MAGFAIGPAKATRARIARALAAIVAAAALVNAAFLLVFPGAARAGIATTTLRVTICGDGLITGNEICDNGPGNNTGAYSTSTAGRRCGTSCTSFGPYCGDAVLQAAFGEACDDGNNTSNDRCSDVCQIENVPTGGYGGGGYSGGSVFPPTQTKVVVEGKAYPYASVHILRDGEAIGVVEADGSANFYFSTTNVSPGVSTFGFWAEDSRGLKSVALTTTLTIVSGAVTTISGAFVPPTISLDKRALRKGEVLNISGESAPRVLVIAHVNSEVPHTQATTTQLSGAWSIPFDTSPLENEAFHTAKALFETTDRDNIVRSAFSQAISFYVGARQAPGAMLADLNGDGKVNLVDFSILLFYWGSAGPVGDLNSDQRVNLTDFSILLFNWTG